MITLYAFGPHVHPGMKGKGRDLRVQWALEETGLAYRVHPVDFLGGELDSPAIAGSVPSAKSRRSTMTASSSRSPEPSSSISPRSRAS